jgi:hypothetical protein
MTRRTIILGIITVIVVMYGIWDTIETRARRAPARSVEVKTPSIAPYPVAQDVLKKTSPAPAPLPGGDVPTAKERADGEKPGKWEKASGSPKSLPVLPEMADLTHLQRQRANADWGRDPFISAGLDYGSAPGTVPADAGRPYEAQAPALNGIVRFGARHIAIINDKTCLPGDEVQGWRVEKIYPDKVNLRKGEDRLTLAIKRLQEVP